MSNRNDDIKQLFSHLGLNDQDYLELRRQSGGAEAERAKPQPEAEPRPEAPSPGATAAPAGDTTRRFNAQTQPKVFLPGLTSDLGAPEQLPPPTVPRVRRPAPVVDDVAPPRAGTRGADRDAARASLGDGRCRRSAVHRQGRERARTDPIPRAHPGAIAASGARGIGGPCREWPPPLGRAESTAAVAQGAACRCP